MDDIRVVVAGEVFSNWTGLSIQRALTAAATAFTLEVGGGLTAGGTGWAIRAGAEVEVFFGDDLVVEGFVDDVLLNLGRDSHTATVVGRGLTADLIDSAATVDQAPELNGLLYSQIAQWILEPYFITATVAIEIDEGADPRFAVNLGETAFSALERLARLKGGLLYPGAGAELIIARPSDTPVQASLETGFNIEAAQLQYSAAGRFQTYVVRGQRPGSDDESGAVVAQVEGRATDSSVKRYRPMLILAEGIIDNETAKLRAEWEAATRAARGNVVTIRTAEWRPENNRPLWDVNQLVLVKIPRWTLEGNMLVQHVTYGVEAEGGGRFCEMELVRSDAYRPRPDAATGEDGEGFDGLVGEWSGRE